MINLTDKQKREMLKALSKKFLEKQTMEEQNILQQKTDNHAEMQKTNVLQNVETYQSCNSFNQNQFKNKNHINNKTM